MENQQIDYGEVEMSWQVPEYEKHEKSKNWYIVAIVVAILLMVYAFFTQNYLFFGIILISAFVIFLNDSNNPDLVSINLTDEGIVVGKKFYDYDEIKNFSIIYKPKMGVKNLYFEYKSAIKQRLSVPVMDEDPITIRNILLKYLPEDVERTDRPASETLAKILKL